LKKFPSFIQSESKDCGPTCLKIVSKFFGKDIDIELLRNYTQTNRQGSTFLGLFNAAERIGFKAIGARILINDINKSILPCILHWNDIHFVVLYKIKNENFYLSDPAVGLIKFKKADFLKFWLGKSTINENNEGLVLLLEPTKTFFSNNPTKRKANHFSFLLKFLYPFRKYLKHILIGLIIASIIDLIFPFITQKIVDIGIKNKNFHFIYLALFSQIFLYLGKSALEFTRNFILLNVSSRINITLISNFIIKLMSLPIAFFDTKLTGDIMNRINDNHRIERILTTTLLSTLFSIFSLILLMGVLAYYHLIIFFIFFIGSFFYIIWILIFLKRRKILDYKKFSFVSDEQSKIIELINGMQVIKLYNADKQKLTGWVLIQLKLLNISIKSLQLDQTQIIGSNLVNELKNIFIFFISAKLVIDGQITIGKMFAINGIVGALNNPILQLVNFFRESQDARISLERLYEINNKVTETEQDFDKLNSIPSNSDLIIQNLSFNYLGSEFPILENINLKIPSNKVTAIVGSSGSGKTTLMKLLLKFYEPSKGNIFLSSSENNFKPMNLSFFSQKAWRSNIGSVLQDSYIFNDTIANNITIGNENINLEMLNSACKIANIYDFIQTLPLGYNTEIGLDGIGLSMGQKQRLLIARSVYKNPEFIFFDEATSVLDANNETEIMRNLSVFFQNKTVVVIAHRLSTIINADQIIVLENGKVVEVGNHNYLIECKNHYFNLLSNQLKTFN